MASISSAFRPSRCQTSRSQAQLWATSPCRGNIDPIKLGDLTIPSFTTAPIVIGGPNSGIGFDPFNLPGIRTGEFTIPSLQLGHFTLPGLNIDPIKLGDLTIPSFTTAPIVIGGPNSGIGFDPFNLPGIRTGEFTIPSLQLGNFTLPGLNIDPIKLGDLTVPGLNVDPIKLASFTVPGLTVDPIKLAAFTVPPLNIGSVRLTGPLIPGIDVNLGDLIEDLSIQNIGTNISRFGQSLSNLVSTANLPFTVPNLLAGFGSLRS